MKILGFGISEYFELCKKPLIVFLALETMNTILSFFAFETYMYAAALLFFVYMALPMYIGWMAPQRGMTGPRAIIAGIAYGACFGFVLAVVSAIMLTQNQAYADYYYANNAIDPNAPGALSASEMANFYMALSFLFGPVLFGIIFGIVAGIAGLAAKLLGKEKKPEDSWGEGDKKPSETEKTAPKPSKKFRRKR